MIDDKYIVLQIGAGNIGTTHIKNLITDPDIRVIAADANPAKQRGLSLIGDGVITFHTDPLEALEVHAESIDTVSLALPPHLHLLPDGSLIEQHIANWAISQRGRLKDAHPVISLEKPMCHNPEQGYAIMDHLQRAHDALDGNLEVTVDFCLRHLPVLNAAREMFTTQDGQRIGYTNINFNLQAKAPWLFRMDQSKGTFQFLEQVVHIIDAVRYAAGIEIHAISGEYFFNGGYPETAPDDADSPTDTQSLFRYKDGKGNVTGGNLISSVRKQNGVSMTIHGDPGSLYFSYGDSTIVPIKGERRKFEAPEDFWLPYDKAVVDLLKTGNRDPALSTANNALYVSLIAHTAHRSAMNHIDHMNGKPYEGGRRVLCVEQDKVYEF